MAGASVARQARQPVASRSPRVCSIAGLNARTTKLEGMVAVRRLVSFIIAATTGLALVLLAAPTAFAQPPTTTAAPTTTPAPTTTAPATTAEPTTTAEPPPTAEPPTTGPATGPTNDDFANATVINSVPFSITEDTSQATFDPSDPSGCSSNGSVWFAYTPSSNVQIDADTFGSSYDTVLSAWTGTQGALSLIACNDDFSGLQSKISFQATGGTTYYFMVGRCCGDGGNGGGSLTFSVNPTTTGSVTARLDQFGAGLGAYSGTSLTNLTETGCSQYPYYQFVTFRAQANTTYYFQVGAWCCEGFGPVTFHLDVTPNPVASFSFYPGDPSIYDTVQFYDTSYDPAGLGFSSQAWSFGDGATATGCCPTHQYKQDGDYTAELTVTTTDGRTASTSQVVQVHTHDVAIVQLAVPNSAHVGQTIAVNVYVANKRYPETVQVDLYKSIPGGFQQVGSLTQSVPVRPPGGTSTRFAFTSTITQTDGTTGKVTFKAIATILDHRDALPADNELSSTPVRIT